MFKQLSTIASKEKTMILVIVTNVRRRIQQDYRHLVKETINGHTIASLSTYRRRDL